MIFYHVSCKHQGSNKIYCTHFIKNSRTVYSLYFKSYISQRVYQLRFDGESWRRCRGPLNRILFRWSTFSAFFARILQQERTSPLQYLYLGLKGFKGEAEWDWVEPWDIRMKEKETLSRNEEEHRTRMVARKKRRSKEVSEDGQWSCSCVTVNLVERV